ncbi:uncharacterized protein LOC144358163 [Saccoglossus kowalevskii]
MKGLGNTGKANTVNKGNVTDVGALPPLSVADTGRPSTSHSVFEWTNKEVQEWLTNNEIQCKALKQLVGEDIMFLVHMRAEVCCLGLFVHIYHQLMRFLFDISNSIIKLFLI